MSCLTIQWVFFWFYTYSHNTCTLFTKKNITHTIGVNLIYHVCKFSFCWGVAHRSHYGTQFPGQDESLTISVEHGEGIFKHYKIREYQFKILQNWITFSSGYKCVQVWDITCTPCWLYFKWLTCNSFWFDSFHLENIIKQTFLVYLFWKNQPILNKWNYFWFSPLLFSFVKDKSNEELMCGLSFIIYLIIGNLKISKNKCTCNSSNDEKTEKHGQHRLRSDRVWLFW